MATTLIAEVGLNHMGLWEYADEYLAALLSAGFGAVTFQVRESAFYAKSADTKTLALQDSYYEHAAAYLHERSMQFGVALADVRKVAAFESIKTDFYKVLSKDLGNSELVRALLNTGKPVWVSTGMSNEGEVAELVRHCDGARNLNLIHTQLSYDDADTNLRAIRRLREYFTRPVAFGLHSTSELALYAALPYAPAALFVYVKGRRFLKHRDEEHSISLVRCDELVHNIRAVETMLGSGHKEKMSNRIPDQQVSA